MFGENCVDRWELINVSMGNAPMPSISAPSASSLWSIWKGWQSSEES